MITLHPNFGIMQGRASLRRVHAVAKKAETIYCVKYFSTEVYSPRYAFIGTAPAISRAMDDLMTMVSISKGWQPDRVNVVRRVAGRERRNAKERVNWSVFSPPLQMEGGPEELGRLYARFSHLKSRSRLLLSYKLGPDLTEYIDQHFSGWTGEHASELAASAPKMAREDRSAPISRGLVGRLKRRPE